MRKKLIRKLINEMKKQATSDRSVITSVFDFQKLYYALAVKHFCFIVV